MIKEFVFLHATYRHFPMKMDRQASVPATSWTVEHPHPLLTGFLVCLAAMLLAAHPAAADLKLCNASNSRVGIAIGYQDAKGWATEGWWNIGAQTCEVLLKGAVPSRFIYVYAIDYDRGGEWAGTNYMCTHDKSFAIRDVTDCQRRGYRRTGFFEVDTGDAKDWTIRLSDPESSGAERK